MKLERANEERVFRLRTILLLIFWTLISAHAVGWLACEGGLNGPRLAAQQP
jgi:hypothetical protein